MKKEELKTLSDLAESMHRLAEGLETMVVYLLSDADAEDGVTEAPRAEMPQKPEITLEEVRAVLAAKSAEGHTAEVRKLLADFGAQKLSAVKVDDYAALKAKAETL